MSNKRKRHRANQDLIKPLMRPWIIPVAGLFVISLVAYANSFDVPLVFDDLLSIQTNTGVRFGDYLRMSWLWSRSLLYLTFTLNYYFGGQNVWGYHLVNFVFHTANGIFIFFIAQNVFRRLLLHHDLIRKFAFAAAAFFLAHPIQTESVSYISSRSELVSTFFYALGLLLFTMRPPEKIGFLYSWLLILVLLLALGGKETAITLPAVLFLYDFIFLSGASFRAIISRWRFYATFFSIAIAAGFYVATVFLRGSIGFLPGHLPHWQYFLTQLRVVVKYIQLIFLPAGQNLDYDVNPSLTLFAPTELAALSILLGAAGLAWYLRKRQPVFSFSIFWFFLTLAPTSSFVPILDVMFEHRLYLPMVGVCLSFPILMDYITPLLRKHLAIHTGTLHVCAVILAVLTTAAIVRNHIWRDEVRLWTDAASKSPRKARPYNALSMAYYRRGEYDKALEVNKKALEINPDRASEFYETMGNMYLKLGRYEEAVEVFAKSAEISKTAMTYNNLGVAYLYMWDALKQRRSTMSAAEFTSRQKDILEPATRVFAKSVEIDPDMFWPLDSYVNVMFDRGLSDQLEIEAEEKLRNKDDFTAFYVMGKIKFLQNNFREATQYFTRAAGINRRHKLLFFNFGYALTQIGDLDAAAEKYIEAIRIDPIFMEAYHNLGLVHYRKSDLLAARASFNEVLRLDAKHISSHLYLARIDIRDGKPAAAREHLQVVLGISPGHRDASELWQRIGS